MSTPESESVLPQETVSQPLLPVTTGASSEDAFPDFSDPNLFSGSAAASNSNPTVLTSDAASETLSELSSAVSSATSPTSNTSASPGSKFLLPVPTPSSNTSQASFALSEVNMCSEGGGLDKLPPEIAAADISISADGSFVETTSGLAARELKHRYDQQLGVNKDVRSPYNITAIINQHGKQVYRVGLRSQAQAQDQMLTPELETPPTVASASVSQSQRKRRSRMSITSVFKSSSAQRPPEDAKASSTSVGPSGAPRKLRKPRSIPDFASVASGYFGDAVGSPAPSTGRAHSHSVTGADMPRPIVQTVSVPETPAQPTGDVFSSVMGWTGVPASPMTSSGMTPSSRSLLTPSDTPSQSPLEICSQHSKEMFEQPFGRNVSFDSPFRSSAIFLPSVIREMQSFESAKTARADTHVRSPVGTPHRPDSLNSLASERSVLSDIASDSSLDSNSAAPCTASRAVPSPESCMYTRYPTAVFDVIQNYRGLPMFDTLSAASRQPTIKMSLSSLDGAIPRDDPRFVIWGDVSTNDNGNDAERMSLHESASTRSNSRPQSHSFSSHSRKRSLRAKSQGIPEVREPSPERETGQTDDGSSVDGLNGSRRMLMAATIERWIAQLTSQFDYDELLIFFLTYRTYIGAIDLCHLLICRFHWALEEPSTPQEVMVKQIVRVRTFVAIRYWLLTFFRVDFLTNRELCLLFANWLNALWRDPILDKYNDARNIVKKLKKVAKDCKDAHSRQNKSSSSFEKKGKVMQSIDKILGDLSNGVNFAATLRKVTAAQHEEEDSDVDLDFNPEESSPFSDAAGVQGFASFANQLGPGDSTLASKPDTSVAASPPRPTNSTSRILLQQPLHLTILQHARVMHPGSHLPLTETPSVLPGHHSALSRVVVNTIGRLGRWKRVLSSRSPSTPLPPSGDVSAFDLELNATGDLFAVRGGVGEYLKMIDPATSSPITPIAPELPQVTVSTLGEDKEESSPLSPLLTPTPSPQGSEPTNRTPLAKHADLRPDSPASTLSAEGLQSQMSALEPASPVHRTLSRIRSTDRAESVRSGSSGSFGSLRTTSYLGNSISTPQHQSFPDVVSIDDLDYLSDNSSGESGPARPPGLRPTKRLPNRRDFEFVHRSVDSVSSMGIISRGSVALSEHVGSERSSYSSPRGGLGPTLQQWQVNALIDDLSDDGNDPGDAEAALRRLEGQINYKQQKHKEAKVDGWVRTIQERMAAGDFGHEQTRNLSDDEGDGYESEDDYGMENSRAPDSSGNEEDVTISLPRSSLDSLSSPPSYDAAARSDMNVGAEAVTPTARQTSHPMSSPASEAKPKIDEAVPEEILLSRLPSRSSTSNGESVNSSPPQRNGHSAYTLTKQPGLPIAHRSFILHYRSETLAQHFAVIEREIFLGIKFEELVSEEWMSSTEDFDVRDWMQFLRDRRRKVELRGRGKISVLSAARARFNLVSNFVVSEIALTNPHDRVYIVSKFIRIAWKTYIHNNFATLVAIISGLSSEWVRKAMKRSWSRVGMWEIRVFEDLKAFCTSEEDFHYIRKAIAAIVDAKPLNASGQDDAATTSTGPTDAVSSGNKSKSTADGKVVVPSSCVPFIGVYLSQLHRFRRLPDLIDPSAPTETVDTDPDTGNFKAPAHPEVFSDLRPLPSSMQIEPLINVQKQRKIAGVIKALVAGQHLANKVEVDMDKRLLSRCLKLSALDFDTLQRIFGVYSDY